MAKHGLLFVTVKPESATQVLAEVKDSLSSVSLVVSACAGVPLSRLASAAGELPIARIMPNLLCTIREGATSYCMHNCGETEEALLLRVLQAFGPAYKIPEHQFDAFCAISGSSEMRSFKYTLRVKLLPKVASVLSHIVCTFFLMG